MRTAIVLGVLLTCGVAFANCVNPPAGQVVEIETARCEAIAADGSPEVQAHAGPMYSTWNLKRAYTGALVTDANGLRWMYSSPERDPCAKFLQSTRVRKRAYLTCCDTGRWGKCVFGGRWLGDVNGPPINAFQ